MSDWYDYDEEKDYWDDQEDEDDWSDYEDIEDRPLTLADRFDQWFSRTRIGRLYWRIRYAIRNHFRDPLDIPF